MTFNARQLEANIRQLGERAVKGMYLVAKKRAFRVRDLAREYAPERTGALEQAIDVATKKDANRRNSYTVYIDLDRAREGGPGNVGDYAFLMEEQLAPYGSGKYKLGVGSLLKRAATGKKVGGRFLRRAVNEGTKGLLDEMVVEVRRVMNDTRQVPMNYQRVSAESDE